MAENTFLLKLSNGMEIIPELEKLSNENNIDYGMFVSGFGKIKQFELISHEQKGGVSKTRFEGEFELNAISGKIQKTKSGLGTSIRVSVTSTGFTPKAGQLVSGKAAGNLELAVRKIDFRKIIEA